MPFWKGIAFFSSIKKLIANRQNYRVQFRDSVWKPLPTFEESGSRQYDSRSRHLTKDPKTDLISVRSKLLKTVSLDAHSKTLGLPDVMK